MRAAIIGTGGIAHVHARLIRDLGGELVGACGRTLASARAFGGAIAYDDPIEMLRTTRPDVVHVCSPHRLHAEHSIAAFAAGAHVVCEKPMATSVDDCERMIEAAAQAGRVGAIVYSYRGYPLIEILRMRVASGDFGKLRRINGLYLSQDIMPADKYVWAFSPGTSGHSFALMDLGVHWLDMVEYVTGEQICQITAQFSTHQKTRIWRGAPGHGPRPPGIEIDGGIAIDHGLEEQADLMIRLRDGAAGGITISAVAPGHPNTILLSVDGPARGFDWSQSDPNVYLDRSEDGAVIRQRRPEALPASRAWMSVMPSGHAEGYLDAFRNIISQAWAAMRGDDTPFPTFADGMRGIKLTEAAVRSAAQRSGVDI